MIETQTKDSLIIGGKKILTTVCELDQANLKFFPENPRVYSALNSDGSVPSQEDIEEHMKKLDHVRDLRDDIEKNGGLIEPIIVRNGDFVVLEGNSRLAAYRLLAERDAIKWGKIKCTLLPNDITEDMIFKLIGQFHIKGKKPWDPYEQASYLYRRSKETKTPIEIIAEELNIKSNDAKRMVEAVTLMKEHNEIDNKKYSYYLEYIKDSSIRKYRETNPDIDDTIIGEIKSGSIQRAEDIRLLAKVAKVGDKQSKKLMKKIVDKEISIYDAYDDLEDDGKLESCLIKLKKFKEYVNGETFEKSMKCNKNTYVQGKYEINKIIQRLNSLIKKWEKDDND